ADRPALKATVVDPDAALLVAEVAAVAPDRVEVAVVVDVGEVDVLRGRMVERTALGDVRLVVDEDLRARRRREGEGGDDRCAACAPACGEDHGDRDLDAVGRGVARGASSNAEDLEARAPAVTQLVRGGRARRQYPGAPCCAWSATSARSSRCC